MTVLMPWERLDGKVTGRHRDALAVVYVRQSTRQQVLDHGESTRLQYALADRAVALGWQAGRVLVIDDGAFPRSVDTICYAAAVSVTDRCSKAIGLM